MCKIERFILIFCPFILLINALSKTSCIPSTPCQCYLTENSFILNNCSHTLPDLPIFSTNTSLNITKILVRQALIRWPLNLCRYSNIEILDLSGSYFNSRYVHFSCLSQLIFLNLSYSQLKHVPNFEKNPLNHLEIMDLSNNNIEFLNGTGFHLLNNLKRLYLENNPLKQIDYFEHLLTLSNIHFINLMSNSSNRIRIRQITTHQWISIANHWNKTNKSLVIRTNKIPFQTIFPNIKQFRLISFQLMSVILKTLSNSTFTNYHSTPECSCLHLRTYQSLFSFINFDKSLSSLFQYSTCLMPNGFIHARLFDRRTLIDFNCTLLSKKIVSTTTKNSSSFQNCNLFLISVLIFIHFSFIEKMDKTHYQNYLYNHN